MADKHWNIICVGFWPGPRSWIQSAHNFRSRNLRLGSWLISDQSCDFVRSLW